MIRRKKKIYFILVAIVFVALSVVVVRWHIVKTSEHYIMATDDFTQVKGCQNVIILGSRVLENGKMSGILRERAMAAVDIYNEGKVCNILISGDSFGKNGSDYDEVDPVKQFLISEGVDSKKILIDENGFDTFSSMKNAREIFKFEHALIVTQEFHLSRSVYIARALDIDARGYVAYKYPYPNKREKWRNYIREYLAAVKAIFEVNVKN